MRNAVTNMILEINEAIENPFYNIDRIFSVLERARKHGIELEKPSLRLLERNKVTYEQNTVQLDGLNSFHNCLSRFLLNQKISYEEKNKVRDIVLDLESKIQDRISFFKNRDRLLRLKITDDNKVYFENILQQLIGRVLEKEILPNLMEKMGYEEKTTTFNLIDKVLEIDGRYEEKIIQRSKKGKTERKADYNL